MRTSVILSVVALNLRIKNLVYDTARKVSQTHQWRVNNKHHLLSGLSQNSEHLCVFPMRGKANWRWMWFKRWEGWLLYTGYCCAVSAEKGRPKVSACAGSRILATALEETVGQDEGFRLLQSCLQSSIMQFWICWAGAKWGQQHVYSFGLCRLDKRRFAIIQTYY